MRRFPECLERSDLAGIVRSRTPETEAAYRKRYAGMDRTLARKLNRAVCVVDLIEDIRSRASHLKVCSFYLYRATILQHCRDEYEAGRLDEQEAEALVARLMPEGGWPSIGSKVSEVRTSAQSRKHVKPEGFGTLASFAYSKEYRTYQIVGGLLEYGPALLTRPRELLDAQLIGRHLTVRSAKWSTTNRKGTGEFRKIGLMDAVLDWELPDFRKLLALLREDMDEVGDPTRLVRRYGGALRRLRRGVPWAIGITLKSTRSQGRANLARAGYNPFEIASIMGHASAETAASHYGKANKGWKPVPGRSPLAICIEELAKVRSGARAKSKIARQQPTTFTEARSAFWARKSSHPSL